MVNRRVKERDLVEPALYLIANESDEYGGLDVTRIDKLLRGSIVLSDEDKQILKGRKDDRFSQVVRNLVSHRTLERTGYAEYRLMQTYQRGAYFLTPKGAVYLGVTYKKPPPDLFTKRSSK